MTDEGIFRFAEQYRIALEAVHNAGLFTEVPFLNFPKGCCGDTSYLLAEFLRSKGQESIYVWGSDFSSQTHAWLVIKDERINIPKPNYLKLPDNIKDVLNVYSNGAYNNPIDVSHYSEEDVEKGLIVDITADQFGETPVYVGYMRDFYKRFEFQQAHDYTDLRDCKLREIYCIVFRFLSDIE